VTSDLATFLGARGREGKGKEVGKEREMKER